jgi:hypothetical protein
MTPEERQLITSLFDRHRRFGRPDKDGEAEALINQSVRTVPDAPYMLVQTTLIQEQALEAAHMRVEELEGQLRDLEEERQKASSSSGSFLGGLFGGRPTSAPGSRGREGPPPLSGSPQQQMVEPSAPGGFMRSAMTTAAGVAGGMLVASSIRNMMGASANASPGSNGSGSNKPENTDRADNAAADAADLRPDDNDPGTEIGR